MSRSINEQIAELRSLIEANECRIRVARTDVQIPRVLDEQIKRLETQIEELMTRLDALIERRDNRQSILDSLLDRREELQRELKLLVHRDKIAKLHRLQRELDAL